jgi:deoxyribonuclease-4
VSVTYFIGAHTIDSGGLDQAVRRAAAAEMTALQIFTAIPKYYNEKVRIRPERTSRFREALATSPIGPAQVLVHAAYVINTASPEPEKAEKAARALTMELQRTTAVGALGCCFHPGSTGTGDVDSAIARIADAVTAALEAVPGSARILLENTAGGGKTVGRKPEEIGAILDRIPPALRPRAGYGLDTCHLFAAGHDIGRSSGALRDVLDAFEEAARERPAFFHLNDSAGALGSNRDRHALIGQGALGTEPFRWLLHDPRAEGIPLILETPQANPAIADTDASADPWDAQMIALLRDMLP